MGLSQVFLKKGLEHPVVSAYHKFQVDMAVLYGADQQRAEKEMLEAFNFEVGLANVSSLISVFNLSLSFVYLNFFLLPLDFADTRTEKKRLRFIQSLHHQRFANEISVYRLAFLLQHTSSKRNSIERRRDRHCLRCSIL